MTAAALPPRQARGRKSPPPPPPIPLFPPRPNNHPTPPTSPPPPTPPAPPPLTTPPPPPTHTSPPPLPPQSSPQPHLLLPPPLTPPHPPPHSPPNHTPPNPPSPPPPRPMGCPGLGHDRASRTVNWIEFTGPGAKRVVHVPARRLPPIGSLHGSAGATNWVTIGAGAGRRPARGRPVTERLREDPGPAAHLTAPRTAPDGTVHEES